MPGNVSTDPVRLPAPADRLRRRLRDWFRVAARDLPWRRRRTLYGTWIAEAMLQQTTVATVRRRWEEFLARFPDVRALAAADEEAVLAAWSGLGYYGRARRLLAAARRLAAAGGELPRTAAAWRELPGVGPYTAAAVASLGAGEAVAVVDTNVRRVLLRLCCDTEATAAALRPAALAGLAEVLLDRERPGEWNEALMELGALVCRPADPRCGECPWRRDCRAARAGAVHRIPPPRNRAPAAPVLLSALVVMAGRRVLLLPPGSPPAARPAGWDGRCVAAPVDLWPGLWGVPLTPWLPAAEATATRQWEREAAAAWRRWSGVAATPRRVADVRHGVTRFRLQVVVHRLAADPGFRPPGTRWFDLPLSRRAPVSSLTRKVVAAAAAAV